MSVDLQTSLARQVEEAIETAGLRLQELESGTASSGEPTLRFLMARSDAAATRSLELSSGLDLSRSAGLREGLEIYLREEAIPPA